MVYQMRLQWRYDFFYEVRPIQHIIQMNKEIHMRCKMILIKVHVTERDKEIYKCAAQTV